MEQPFFEDVFQAPIEAFTAHLDSDMNERIIVSGKYGIGKTRFLFQYFQQDQVAEKYDVYYLMPVNYAIAANEDIIGYIKYDIVLEMLRNGFLLSQEMKTYMQTLPVFIIKRLDKVLAALIGMIPEVGKSVLELYERLGELKDEYLSFHDKENETKGDALISFIDELESKGHSLFDNDVITKIIVGTIASRAPKRSVLVVDDIDRLDPEHVFRILNIFAAQFDVPTSTRSKNKFGFDKVIMVCDLHNIRHIFHHRYGSEVDFMGYIDKFFSSDIYFFDNRSALRNIVKNIMTSMVFGPDNQYQAVYNKSLFIQQVLDSFIENQIVSLRALLKFYGKTWRLHEEKIEVGPHGRTIPVFTVPILMHIKLMTHFLGDYNTSIKTITQYKQRNIALKNADNYFGLFLYVLFEDMHKFAHNDYIQVDFHDVPLLLTPHVDFSTDIVQRVIVNRFEGWEGEENPKARKGNLVIPTPQMFWTALLELMEKLYIRSYLN